MKPEIPVGLHAGTAEGSQIPLAFERAGMAVRTEIVYLKKVCKDFNSL